MSYVRRVRLSKRGRRCNNNCVLENSSSDTQQTKPVGAVIAGTGKSHNRSMEPPNVDGGKAISNKYFKVFTKKIYLIAIGS